jgi:hypothetical protein
MRKSPLVLIGVGALLLGCSGGDMGRPGPVGGGGGSPEPTGGSGGTGGGSTGGTGGSSYGGSGGGGGSTGGNNGGNNMGGTGGGSAPTPDAGTPSDGPSTSADAGPSGPPTLGTGIYNGMTKIFNGTDLSNWSMSPASSWVVKDGVMASTGNGRGYIATKADYGDYRLIFTSRQVKGDHALCILLFGIRPPPNNALGAIQFQQPNGGTWDYRVGKNNAGGTLFTRLPHPSMDKHMWSQCEVLAKGSKGEFRAACCTLTGTGPCKAVEVLRFKDPTAARKGPVAWQMHNGGIFDEYKDAYIEENPMVDDLITTK